MCGGFGLFVHIAKANSKNEPARLERNFYDPHRMVRQWASHWSEVISWRRTLAEFLSRSSKNRKKIHRIVKRFGKGLNSQKIKIINGIIHACHK